MINLTTENIPGLLEPAVRRRWHLITSEYPPQSGGVSDYTHGVALGLAEQGDDVHVWCPPHPAGQPEEQGITVHREMGGFSPADLERVAEQMNRFPGSRRILVQWVPHGYGYRSMNLAFCWWLWKRSARSGDQVDLMVHEPFLEFRPGLSRQNIPALVHRIMTILLLRAAHRVWISIPGWEAMWQPYALGRKLKFQWLPIPSNIPVAETGANLDGIRSQYVPEGGILAGHFGTYGSLVATLLKPILCALCAKPAKQAVVLIGQGSERFREELIRTNPELEHWIQATGGLAPEQLSRHLAACDLLIQPYPDGVSTRRTSFMAGLAHGKPIVTTAGELTEPLWRETSALALAPAGDTEAFVDQVRSLAARATERERMGRAAGQLYRERFDMRHTIVALRQAECTQEDVCAF